MNKEELPLPVAMRADELTEEDVELLYQSAKRQLQDKELKKLIEESRL